MTTESTNPSAEAGATPTDLEATLISSSPRQTFDYGARLSAEIRSGDIILLFGGLGAGKTLFTKGIMSGLGFDVDEVTSPSFALVNLYKTAHFDVYHIDLWRTEAGRAAVDAVGLEEILETPGAVAIVEWAEKLENIEFPNRTIAVHLDGDGGDPRRIHVRMPEDNGRKI